MAVRKDSGGEPEKSGEPHSAIVPPRSVVGLARPKREARQMLTSEQYWNLVEFICRLYDFGDPSLTIDLDIKRFGRFWEYSVRGGFIRGLNLKVYFAFVRQRNEIVILLVYNQDEARRVPPHIHIILEDRLEDYLLGSTHGASVYPKRGGQRSDP